MFAWSAKVTLDKTNATLGFDVIKFKIGAPVKGTFNDLVGSYDFDVKTMTLSAVELTIPTNTVNTADEKRDEHLKSADFFDATKYPNMIFKSTGNVVVDAKKETDVPGQLTIKDKTQDVVLKVKYLGLNKKTNHYKFKISTVIERSKFNISFNKPMDKADKSWSKDILAKFKNQLIDENVNVNAELQ